MKKFIELVKRMHQERYSVTINKILAEKIPVTFLTIAPVESALETIKNLRGQGLTIDCLITASNPPPPRY